MGKLTHILLGMALTLSAFAQSAASFDTKATATERSGPKEKTTSKTLSKEAGPVSATPSRYVGPAEMLPYLESVSSVFLIRGRTLDSFGQTQDPNAKPVIKASVATAIRRVAPVQSTPFSEIVRMLVVTTIMPSEQRFLVGTRSFKQGGPIPLSHRNKLIRAQVTEVTSRQISFLNLDTGETASRKLDMLPAGMTPGSRKMTAPGMAPDLQDAPIELESGDSTP